MIPRLTLISLATLTLLSPAATEEMPELSAAQIRTAIGHLESDHPANRAATYKACRERGDAFRATYRKMLDQARASHIRKISTTINTALGPRTSAGKMLEAWRAWEGSSRLARESAQTNHNKEKSKLNEIDRLFAAAEADWKKLRPSRNLGGDAAGDPVAQSLADAFQPLAEISRELAWVRDPDQSVDEPGLAELEREFSLGSLASSYLKAHAALTDIRSALEAAHTANDSMAWADARQKEFARILNDRRTVLGLPPLRLNEKLSNACRLHSQEMERLGYFAHESPVEENKTFGMRARKAGFEGAIGECIYMGRREAAAAEQAWWYSCGHRVINYSSRPDTLGIGPHNSHWTLNTGSAR